MDFSFLAISFIQGLTEFLPISSSGHITLVVDLFGVKDDLSIHALLHFATLLAVIVYFRNDIFNLIRGYLANQEKEKKYVHTLVIATIPIIIVGLFLFDSFRDFQFIKYLPYIFIFSGLFLLFADFIVKKGFTRKYDENKTALAIGLFQILALVPGVSRSGTTIAAGILFGKKYTEAARFSFLLSIPTIAGAFILNLINNSYVNFDFSMSIFIIVLTFTVAYLTIHLFMKYINIIGLKPFAIYQILLAILLIVLF